MPTDATPWIRLSIAEEAGGRVSIAAQGSGGRGGEAERVVALSLEDLQDFTRQVRSCARGARSLDVTTVQRAQNLFEAVFSDNVLELVEAYVVSAPRGRVLIRLALEGDRVRDVAWEAMRAPDRSRALAASTSIQMVREVAAGASAAPPQILPPVRVLVVAATSSGVPAGIAIGLTDAIATGAAGSLDVVAGAQVATRAELLDALHLRSATGKRPHILHIVADGLTSRSPDLARAAPVLQWSGVGDEPVEVAVETLAGDLERLFGEDLRLVALELTQIAEPGASVAAGEILARRAAVAVLTPSWPLQSPIGAAVAKSFYASLTWTRGDVAESLDRARSELSRQSADAFSPVLYLRGDSSALFDFDGPPALRPPEVRETPAAEARRPVAVFVSADGSDEAFVTALRAHLAPMIRQRRISVWDPGQITAGADWKATIEEHVAGADLVIVLQSPQYLASDYQYDVEGPRVLERLAAGELAVASVILRPCSWQEGIYGQVAPLRGGDPVGTPGNDEAWVQVVGELRSMIDAAAASRPPEHAREVVTPSIFEGFVGLPVEAGELALLDGAEHQDVVHLLGGLIAYRGSAPMHRAGRILQANGIDWPAFRELAARTAWPAATDALHVSSRVPPPLSAAVLAVLAVARELWRLRGELRGDDDLTGDILCAALTRRDDPIVDALAARIFGESLGDVGATRVYVTQTMEPWHLPVGALTVPTTPGPGSSPRATCGPPC